MKSSSCSLALFLGYPLPLAAVQILWINIVTEGMLTVNLVMEGLEGDEMRRPPIPRDEPLITRTMLERMAVMVAASVAATFGWFVVAALDRASPFAAVQTETFTLLAVCQWFNVAELPQRNKVRADLASSETPGCSAALLANLVLQFAVIYTAPMNRIFHTVPIPLADGLLIIAVASLVLWAEETRKFFARRKNAAN